MITKTLDKIKMNKKALSFQLAFMALVAISVIVISMDTWITEWNEDYDSGITYDLDDYEKLSELEDEAKTGQGSSTITSTNTDEEFESTGLRGVFGYLNNIYKSFSMVTSMVKSLSNRFGLPTYIIRAFFIVMTMAITYALIKIIFRTPRRYV